MVANFLLIWRSFFYVSYGFILLITGLDVKIIGIEAQNISSLSTAIGIPATFLPPNAFLFEDPTGWTIFELVLNVHPL
jgi:hypothetical protein